jgi:hypothetical protein
MRGIEESELDLDALAALHGIDLGPTPEVVEQPATVAPERPSRRLWVHRTEHDPEKPWRAAITDQLGHDEQPVGAFATHAEAIRTGCTALTFLANGIPWRVPS